MLLKIVISPNLVITHYPTLHNFGLTDETLPGFVAYVGENFGYHELQYLVRGMLDIEKRIAELEKRDADLKKHRQGHRASWRRSCAPRPPPSSASRAWSATWRCCRRASAPTPSPRSRSR